MLPVLSFLAKTFLLTNFVVNRLTNENVIVRLSHGGLVRGAILRSDEGRPFYAFRGIPYAEPPVGQLRFKAPVPKTGWTKEVFDATKEGASCVQHDTTIQKRIRGDEDCLTINVYTHQLPLESKRSSRPFPKRSVMVFFYGGGFKLGDGTSQTYNPVRMMDSDVILVTLNYRLDALGFLSTEDESAPGNYGLLDQVLALRWVQENIELFGGDAESVTIFGESAGGASVSYHLLSPLSKGLFHRAIMMSGSSLCPWAYVNNPLRWATFAANASGCPTEPTSALVDCLRTLPATKLVGGMFGRTDIPQRVPFGPIADGHFLLASPRETMKYPEKIYHIPVMSGITTNEAAVFIRVVKRSQLQEQGNTTALTQDFIDGVLTNAVANRKPQVVEMIKRQYFSTIDQQHPREVEKAFIDAASDGLFNMPHYEQVELLSEAAMPVFVYRYDYVPEAFGPTRHHGASHFEDLLMLFDIQWLGKVPLSAKDRKMSKVMRKLWTNFAKTGNPTPDDDEASALPKWTPSSPGKIRIHHLAQPMGRVSTYDVQNDARFHFWTKEIPEARHS